MGSTGYERVSPNGRCKPDNHLRENEDMMLKASMIGKHNFERSFLCAFIYLDIIDIFVLLLIFSGSIALNEVLTTTIFFK